MTFEEKKKFLKEIWKWLNDSGTLDEWLPTPKPRIGPELVDVRSIEFGNPVVYNSKQKIHIPPIDQSKATGGYGKPMQIIPNGEWSLICAIRGGKKDGR